MRTFSAASRKAAARYPHPSLFCFFISIDPQGSHDTKEDFGIIHGDVEIFGAGAAGIEKNVVSGMAFLL